METQTVVNVSQTIDRSTLGSFQRGIIALCAVCVIMDGFNTQAMGYVAPTLIREWGITNRALGPVFSAALIGILIGSLGTSMLADRIGRRPVLVGAVLYCSILTFLTAQVNSVAALFWIRLGVGIGLGAILPNAMALTGEYTPARIRVIAMVIVSSAFPLGAAIGGVVSAWMIPDFGWHSIFYLGAIVPLAGSLLMFWGLPESLQFMVLHQRGRQRIESCLARIDPRVPFGDNVAFVVNEKMKRGVPAIQLFRDSRTGMTILLWIISFMNLLTLYFLSSWIPTVLRDAGYGMTPAVLAGAVFQFGGMLSSFAMGWLVGRRGLVATLLPILTLACVSVVAIGHGLPTIPLFSAVFFAGCGIVGSQPVINALATVYYPTSVRSTGIGWALGIGRVGAIVGPPIGGHLIGLRWANRELFLAASLPIVISALGVLMIRLVWDPSRRGTSFESRSEQT